MISFHVAGVPVPQGSMRPVRAGGKAGGKILLVAQAGARLRVWRRAIGAEAARHSPDYLIEGPVSLQLVFHMQRAQKPVPGREDWPTGRPDLDKLVRAVLDALTGVLFVDDSQVVNVIARKEYGAPGVTVDVVDMHSVIGLCCD